MRLPWAQLVTSSFVFAAAVAAAAEPAIVSVHPFTVQAGGSTTATIRGTGLTGAHLAFGLPDSIRIKPESVVTEPKGMGTGRNKASMDLLTVRIEVGAGTAPGRYPFRIVTPGGVSNALPVHVIDLPVAPEPEGSHNTPDSAVPVERMPVTFAGRLDTRGEADFYAFQANAGDTLTFEVVSGLPQIAAGGSAATIANFDPSLAIYEAGSSWFDAARLKRIAHNDEPVWVFGKPTDAHLVHKFERAGSYLLRVEAFAGQGGLDYSYHLKVARGERPQDLPAPVVNWDERTFSRDLTSNRLQQLAERGVGSNKTIVETYRATPEGAKIQLPGTVTGSLAQPGETHKARFTVDGPTDLAIEVETPAAAPPFFNPMVRLLNGSGEEVATNLFAGKGACSGALTKSLQAKTLVPVREAGEYTIEVRDATADLAGPDFQYKVQIRPQVPHIGKVNIAADRMNLAQGEAKTFRVVFDREEDYRGAIAVMAESLPAGVHMAVGADFEPDKDPPLTTGKRERYVPRQERAVVVLTADAEAAPTTAPQLARIVVRPVANGKMGAVIASQEIPLMVVKKAKQ